MFQSIAAHLQIFLTCSLNFNRLCAFVLLAIFLKVPFLRFHFNINLLKRSIKELIKLIVIITLPNSVRCKSPLYNLLGNILPFNNTMMIRWIQIIIIIIAIIIIIIVTTIIIMIIMLFWK